jgi:hypothetical protein
MTPDDDPDRRTDLVEAALREAGIEAHEESRTGFWHEGWYSVVTVFDNHRVLSYTDSEGWSTRLWPKACC